MESKTLDLVAIANELEAFIQSCIPEASTRGKYGGTLFTLKPEEKEGQFCGVFVYANHVQLSFSQGTKLQDPRKLLCGNGKFRRHLNFKSGDEIDFPYIQDLICQSARL